MKALSMLVTAGLLAALDPHAWDQDNETSAGANADPRGTPRKTPSSPDPRIAQFRRDNAIRRAINHHKRYRLPPPSQQELDAIADAANHQGDLP